MGFADEVKQAQETRGNSPESGPNDAPPQEPTATPATAPQASEQAPETPAPAAAPAPEEASDAAAFYKGLKEIKSPDEAVAYIRELENKVVAASFTPPPAPATTEPATAQPNINLTELQMKMLSDPQAALQEVMDVATKSAKAAVTEERVKENYWQGFYKRNPELDNFRDLVELATSTVIANAKAQKETLSVEDGEKRVIRYVSGILERAKSSVEEVPTRVGALHGGKRVPTTPVETTPKFTSFIDEVKSLQSRSKSVS